MPRPRNAVEVAELRSKVWDLRCSGVPVWRIAKSLGIGPQYVYKLIDSMLEELRPPPEQVVEQRQLSLERLDALTAANLRVLSTEHFMVSEGRVVRHPDTDEPLRDDAPIMAATGLLLKIEERRAKLLGLDMPQLVEVEVKVREEADAAFEAMVAKARERKAAAKAFDDIDRGEAA